MQRKIVTAVIVLCSIIGLVLAGAAGASAQTNVCGTNPSPVDAGDPDITVDSPTAGAAVTSPLTVTGEARTFEATVQVALFDADANEIAATFGTAAAPEAGQHGPFSIELDFSVTATTDACLWVFEDSAETGEPINVVQVPVSLEAPAGLPTTGTAAPEGGSTELPVFVLLALGVAGVIAGGALLVRMRSR